MLRSSHKRGNEKWCRSDASYFYSDAYTSNGVGANAPKKGIALIPFVKNNPYLN